MPDVNRSGWWLLCSSFIVSVSSTVLLARQPGGYQAAAMLNAVAVLHAFAAVLNISETSGTKRPPSTVIYSAVMLDVLRLTAVWRCVSGPVTRAESIVGAGTSLLVAASLTLMMFTIAAIIAAGHRKVVVDWVDKHTTSRSKPTEGISHLLLWFDENRVLPLIFLFAVFLHVTNFMALAIAFDDVRASRRSIYPTVSERPFSGSDDRSTKGKAVPEQQIIVASASERRDDTTEYERIEVNMFFDRASASLAQSLDVWARNDAGRCGHANPYAYQAYVRKIWPRGGDEEVNIASANIESMCTLLDWFKKRANQPGISPTYRILLLGHADPDAVRGQYDSNAELSAGRAHQVQLAVQGILRTIEKGKKCLLCSRVRWELIPGASEEQFLDKAPHLWPTSRGIRQDRSVEIMIEKIKPIGTDRIQLSLSPPPGRPRDLWMVDYLYFMIYTITTTGYGDLVPVSATSKLIVSIANLLEIAFLAVVFNLAFARPAKECEYVRRP